MTLNQIQGSSLSTYSPKKYWSELAEDYAGADRYGFAPVMHPNAPVWFNRMIDAVQFRAIRRALNIGAVSPGTRILDVGCGTGRWIRRYRQLGLSPTGIDVTFRMLMLARQKTTAVPVAAGDAGRLPFASEAFGCVSDITVVQHLPPPRQEEALRELIRVLVPGGTLILMELIRGQDVHIFPRRPDSWIRQVCSYGAKLISWFPEEYLVFDRSFVWTAQTMRGRNLGEMNPRSLVFESDPQPASLKHRIYWRIRRMTLPMSVWTEPFFERFAPANWATHGVFIFRK